MLSFREMIYVVAVGTICFLSCIFKTAYKLRGAYGGLVNIYYAATVLLFAGTILIFALIRKKCEEYDKAPDRDMFLSIKKMKNVSEIIYLTVFLFFVSTLFDIFNPHYIGSIFRSPARLLTSFPFWESLMGLFTLAFGLKVYFRYFEANKLFSALECENFRKGPKRETSDKYLSWEEYEKNAEKAPLGAPKTIYETPYMEQEKFISENSVEEEFVKRTLTGIGAQGETKQNLSSASVSAPSATEEGARICQFCGTPNAPDSEECSFCGGELGN